MQTAGASELGYATTALIAALFDTLVNKGVLTRADLGMVISAAIDKLRPDQHIVSVKGAIAFIEAATVPEVHRHGSSTYALPLLAREVTQTTLRLCQ